MTISIWRRLARVAALTLSVSLVPAFAANLSWSVKVPELDGVGDGGSFVLSSGSLCQMSFYEATCQLQVGWTGGSDTTLVFDPIARQVIGRGPSGAVTLDLPVGSRTLQLLSHSRSTNPVTQLVGATKSGLPVTGTLSAVNTNECSPLAGATLCQVAVAWSTQNGGAPVIKDVDTGDVLVAGANGTLNVDVPASSARDIALYAFAADAAPISGAVLTVTAHEPLQVTGSITIQTANPCTPVGGATSCVVQVAWTSQNGAAPIIRDVVTGEILASGVSGSLSVSITESSSRDIALYATSDAVSPVDGTAKVLMASAGLNVTGTVTVSGGGVCAPGPMQADCSVSVTWHAQGGGSPELRDVSTGLVLGTGSDGTRAVVIPAGTTRTVALYPNSTSSAVVDGTQTLLRAGVASSDVGVVYGAAGNQCVPAVNAASCNISVYWTASSAAPVLRDVDTGVLISSTKSSNQTITVAANSFRHLAVYRSTSDAIPLAYADVTLYGYAAPNGGSFVDSGLGSYPRCSSGGSGPCNLLVTSASGSLKNLTTGTVYGSGSLTDLAISVPAGATWELANTTASGVVNAIYSISSEAAGSPLGNVGFLQANDATTGMDSCGLNAANSTCLATVYAKANVANFEVRDVDTFAKLLTGSSGVVGNFTLTMPNGQVRNLAIFTPGGVKVPGTDMVLRTKVKAAGSSIRPSDNTWVCTTPGGQSTCVKTVLGSAGAEVRLMAWNGSGWVGVHNKINSRSADVIIPAGGTVLVAMFPDANYAGSFEPIPGTEVILYATPAP